MARLIRTEKEVEGSYESLDRRRGGRARPVAGRAARASSAGRRARIDGPERARGEARYTADLPPPGDAARGRAAQPARARRACARSTSRRALALPGVRAAISGRTTSTCCTDEPRLPGRAGRGRRRRHARRRRTRPSTRRRRVGRRSSRCSTPTRRSRRWLLIAEHGRLRARRRRAGFAEADVVVEAEYRTQTRPPQLARDAPGGLRVAAATTLDVYISTQCIWGVRDRRRASGSSSRRTRCASSASSWAAASARRTAPATTRCIAAELARRTGRPVRCALTRREENLVSRQPQRDDPAAARRRALRRHADRARRRVHVRASAGAAGSRRPPGRCRCSTPARTSRTIEHGAKLNTPPMAAFRAPGLRRGDVRPRVPARRAGREARRSTRSSCGAATTPTRPDRRPARSPSST